MSCTPPNRLGLQDHVVSTTVFMKDGERLVVCKNPALAEERKRR